VLFNIRMPKDSEHKISTTYIINTKEDNTPKYKWRLCIITAKETFHIIITKTSVPKYIEKTWGLVLHILLWDTVKSTKYI